MKLQEYAMETNILSARYGKAVCELAEEHGDIDSFIGELKTMKAVFGRFPDFVKILSDGSIDKKRRFELADSVFSKLSVGSILTNTIKLLVEKGRVNIATAVIENAGARLKRRMNIATVDVRVADESIADDCRKVVEQMMGEILKSNVECEISIDRSLLGGFTVKHGDRVYDASLKGKLASMMETIA